MKAFFIRSFSAIMICALTLACVSCKNRSNNEAQDDDSSMSQDIAQTTITSIDTEETDNSDNASNNASALDTTSKPIDVTSKPTADSTSKPKDSSTSSKRPIATTAKDTKKDPEQTKAPQTDETKATEITGEPDTPQASQKPNVPQENETSKTMYVTASSLSVRKSASQNSETIDKLYHCEAIQVYGESTNGWYKTIDANGIEGYCSAKYLTEDAPKPNYKSPYLIKVNRKQNIVIIYEKDESGEFNTPIKAMICSVGLNNNTPLGIFNTTNKYEWRPLYNGVFGQYGTRVVGDIMIHSVPYFSMDRSDLEYEEYNKLGEPASLGCVRLEVENVKWIYDNCPIGTTVIIYDSDEAEPLARPTAAKIDPSDPNRGWDPTDPDKNNPWKIS